MENPDTDPPTTTIKKPKKVMTSNSTFNQISALYSKEFVKETKAWKSNVFVIVVMTLITILLSYFSKENPTLFPVFIVSILAVDQSQNAIASMGVDRKIKFKNRIGLYGISDFSYFAGLILFRFSVALLLGGYAMILHFFLAPSFLSIFSSIEIFLVFSVALMITIFSNFALYFTISFFVRDPDSLNRVMPMVIGLLNVYPMLSVVVNTEYKKIFLMDYFYAFFFPPGSWYFYTKVVFIRLDFTGIKPILIVLFMAL